MRRLCMAGGICLACALVPRTAPAGFDSPGVAQFEFLAEESVVYLEWEAVPADAPFVPAEARAFFSSDASESGEAGVLIWAGLDLQGPGGPRYGMLFLDVDLARVDPDGYAPLPHRSVRAGYLESRGDTVLFEGQAVAGHIWIVDHFTDGDDQGGLEGEFSMILRDPQGRYPGSRVLLEGWFTTDPTAAALRGSMVERPDRPGDEESGEPVEESIPREEEGGCGGEGGAVIVEGCAEVLAVGCGAVLSDSCEGDTGDGAGVEGDTYEASLPAVRGVPRGAPLGTLLTFLPQILVLGFIRWMRRR